MNKEPKDEKIFEEIRQACTEKKIISLCKKLQKKCSFNSGADMVNLTELAYWLFVYGYEEMAMRVCRYSHIEDPQPMKVNYNVWDFILFIWGLEAYMYRKQGKESACQERIGAMDRVWSIPTRYYDTVEKQRANNQGIRSRLTYDIAISRAEIERSDSKFDANEWRFGALFDMIGYGVTGFYPQLEERKEELQKDIDEYINILRQSRR
ncbi:MAG: hypothetical protein NC429_13840 [Lachnospiraceae bacterium]|nr:hypothetical protein [Lachnospiraceae bacterium]